MKTNTFEKYVLPAKNENIVQSSSSSPCLLFLFLFSLFSVLFSLFSFSFFRAHVLEEEICFSVLFSLLSFLFSFLSFSHALASKKPRKTTKFAWLETGTTENESNDGARNRRKMVSCSNRGSLRWERCLAPGPRLIPRERAQLEDVQKETESIRKINIRRWQRRCRYSPGITRSPLPTRGRQAHSIRRLPYPNTKTDV